MRRPLVTATPSRTALYLDLIRWNRPAGWLLLLWPTLSALWIASEGFPGWHLLSVFTLGTILTGMAVLLPRRTILPLVGLLA